MRKTVILFMRLRPDKKDILFVAVLAVVHLCFFLLTLHYKRLYTGDSFEYVYEAINIRDHSWLYCGNPTLPLREEYLTFRTPLYPLFLLAVYSLGGSNWTVLIIQALVSIGSMLLLRDTLLRIGYRKKYDWLLLLLLLTYPAQFIHANQVEPEMLLQLFSVLYFRSWVLLFREKKNTHAWWAGLWLIAGIFAKPVWYPFVWMHVLLLIVFAIRHPANRKAALLACLLPVLAVQGYKGWNLQRTGVYHVTSNQAFNAIFYYNYYFGEKYGIDSARAFLREERARIAALPSFKARYEAAHRRGRQLLQEHGAHYLPFHAKHSARLLIDPGKGDWDLFSGRLTYGGLYHHTGRGLKDALREEGWLRGGWAYLKKEPSLVMVILVFVFNMLRLIGCFFFLTDRRTIWPIRWWCVLLVAYIALITGPIATPRYLLPVSLVLIGAATLGFQRILLRRQSSADA